ncbi:M55 family metallopeptidase [Paenibacillus flagellatus]|uniref:Aminopeptidase n=1 Tax=Paenibacillus flagellatus TaxID=2211139 RepID=A0A2V5KCI8_9BACL|nr:M55 family metallopeptidase [Paenibacillus flagellatus]PYI57228.1 aminopeptidase [Paenibacillus flagellatus]
MKIYVSVDMEGIAGIALPEQLKRGDYFYQEGRHLLTHEVNAIVEGLLEAGATEIIVKDAHATGYNFVPELLHPGALYCMGASPLAERFPGLDESFDGAMLIGYHGMAGAKRAVRDHTFSSASYQHVELNGKPVGEIALDGHLFGARGVPVLLVTGDDATCREAEAELEGVSVYATKYAVARHAALMKAPQQVRAEIREAVKEAVAGRKRCKPHVIPGPYEMLVRYMSTDIADFKYCDGDRSVRVDGLSVLYRDDDFTRLLVRAL